MNRITSIRVARMWESCQRTTYFVELTNAEGFTMTPASHRTGSIYTDFEGLTVDEARDRALTDAHTWADFLEMEVEPYAEDGVTYEPKRKMEFYTTRRVLGESRVVGIA